MKKSKMNAKPKLIICKNCHQEIEEEKMFLHEGFCIRNNAYCEHCQKVFLKNDYEEHIKTIPKVIPENKNDSPKEEEKENNEEKNINSNPESDNNKKHNLVIEEYIVSSENINNCKQQLGTTPGVEYVQMPLTELYQINTPIIIENGQIISDKNKNEFLLPHLGIDAFQNNKMADKVLDEMINQGDIFKENNAFTRNSYSLEGLKNILNRQSMKNSNPQQQSNINKLSINKKKFSTGCINGQFNINGNKNKNINSCDQNISNDSENCHNKYNHSNLVGINNKTIDYQCFNEDNNLKNKNIIINNNILMSYNSNENKNTSNYSNYYNLQNTPQKKIFSKMIKFTSYMKKTFDSNNNKNISNRQNYNSFTHDIESTFLSAKKEPRDSNSKKIVIKRNRLPGQKVNGSKTSKTQTEISKANIDKKKCALCNKTFNVEEIKSHFKICRKKVLNEGNNKNIRKYFIPKPTKVGKQIITQNNYRGSQVEIGVEDSKKGFLKKQYNESFKVLINNENKNHRGIISNPDRKVSGNILNQYKKIRLKKKLFDLNDSEEYVNNNNTDEEVAEKENKVYEFQKKNKMNSMIEELNNIKFTCNDKSDRIIQKNQYQIKKSNLSTLSDEIDPWLFFKSHYKKGKGGNLDLYNRKRTYNSNRNNNNNIVSFE